MQTTREQRDKGQVADNRERLLGKSTYGSQSSDLVERSTVELQRLRAAISTFNDSSDALLNLQVSRERQRATEAANDIEAQRFGVSNALNQGTTNRDTGVPAAPGTQGEIGRLRNTLAGAVGLGPKQVGPVSEILVGRLFADESDVRENADPLSNIKTRVDYKIERFEAMNKFAINLNSDVLDGDSISLEPGATIPNPELRRNKYGPSQAFPLAPYSQTDGAIEAAKFANRVFPFKIVNLAKDKTPSDPHANQQVFPAYIRTIAETLTAAWSQKSYFGRSEDVHIYNRGSRSMTMSFLMMATTNEETESLSEFIAQSQGGYGFPGLEGLISRDVGIPGFVPQVLESRISKKEMWEKISFLDSLLYPAYDEDGRFQKAPYIRFTLGSLYEHQLAFVTSLTHSYEPLIWDLNDQYITPMLFEIQIAMTLIHDTPPGILGGTEFGYETTDETTPDGLSRNGVRFLHRDEFGGNDAN